MRKSQIFFLFLFCGIFFPLQAQFRADVELRNNAVDTPTRMVWVDANYAYQFPFGSLAQTFKSNSNIGVGLTYKTAGNWTYGVGFNYLFGSKVKNQAAVLGEDMLTSHGDLIDGNGQKATIYFEGRYWNLSASFGKIVPLDKWKNSGLWFRADFGFFEHKIRITDPDSQIPQLLGDYKKGYDQRAAGFCMTQFIGYVFMRKVRVTSFYAGIEVSEIWTKSNRNWQFLLHGKDESKKFSVLLGIKVGWIIPIYEKRKIETLYRY